VRGPGDQVDRGGGALNLITRITGPVLCSIASGSIGQARTHLQGLPPYRLLHDRPPSANASPPRRMSAIVRGVGVIAAALYSIRTASPRRPSLLKPRQVANHQTASSNTRELALSKITTSRGANVSFRRLVSCLKWESISTPPPLPRVAKTDYERLQRKTISLELHRTIGPYTQLPVSGPLLLRCECTVICG
jgi:hypothetical protein